MAKKFSFEESESLSRRRFRFTSAQSVHRGELVLQLSPGGFPAFSETEEASALDWDKSERCVHFGRVELGKAGSHSELLPVACVCAGDSWSVLASDTIRLASGGREGSLV